MNKSNLTNWLAALCAILLIVLLVLQTKQKSQLETLRQEYQTFVSATEQQQEKQRSERETNFREMRQQLDDLVNSGALFPDKSKPAGEAVALAMAAEKAGDTNLAKIYYISAINHAPSEFSMLNDYAELVFRDSAAAPEDFGRLKSVLQISLYQIPPANITNALSLLNETVRREEQLLAAQTPKPMPVNWQERFDQLTNSNTLENSWADLKQISRRWDGLNEILESLHEEQPDSDLTKQVAHELELTQRVLAAARFANALDTMMAALNSSSEQPEKAVSLLQTAEATLGQVWGIDSTGWPAALKTKVDQYPKEIQSRVEIVAEVKSRPAVEKLLQALADVKNYKIGTAENKYQQALLHFDGCISNATEAAQNISSAAGRNKAEAAIKEIHDIALDAKRKQFDAYQKWAVGVCKKAFDEYQDTNFTLSPTRLPTWASTLAKNIFDKSSLAQIDQSLLSSETSRLFNDVLGKLTALMNGQGQFDAEKKIAEATKMTLEDF